MLQCCMTCPEQEAREEVERHKAEVRVLLTKKQTARERRLHFVETKALHGFLLDTSNKKLLGGGHRY